MSDAGGIGIPVSGSVRRGQGGGGVIAGDVEGRFGYLRSGRGATSGTETRSFTIKTSFGGVPIIYTIDSQQVSTMLQSLPQIIQRRCISTALRPAVKLAADIIRPMVPVSGGKFKARPFRGPYAKLHALRATLAGRHIPGALRRSILVRVFKPRTAAERGVLTMGVQTRAGWFRGETFYGAFQEFGWKTGSRARLFKAKGRSAGRRKLIQGMRIGRRQIPGIHFMERGARAAEGAVRAVFAQKLAEAVERAVATGAP